MEADAADDGGEKWRGEQIGENGVGETKGDTETIADGVEGCKGDYWRGAEFLVEIADGSPIAETQHHSPSRLRLPHEGSNFEEIAPHTATQTQTPVEIQISHVGLVGGIAPYTATMNNSTAGRRLSPVDSDEGAPQLQDTDKLTKISRSSTLTDRLDHWNCPERKNHG